MEITHATGKGWGSERGRGAGEERSREGGENDGRADPTKQILAALNQFYALLLFYFLISLMRLCRHVVVFKNNLGTQVRSRHSFCLNPEIMGFLILKICQNLEFSEASPKHISTQDKPIGGLLFNITVHFLGPTKTLVFIEDPKNVVVDYQICDEFYPYCFYSYWRYVFTNLRIPLLPILQHHLESVVVQNENTAVYNFCTAVSSVVNLCPPPSVFKTPSVLFKHLGLLEKRCIPGVQPPIFEPVPIMIQL